MSSAEDQLLQYETLVRRLKVLSKSQSAFLKAHLHNKLAAGIKLVDMAFDVLDSSGSKDPHIQELKRALKAMNLDEIDVDINSAQILMNEEILLLKASADKISGDLLGPSGSNSDINNAAASAASGERLKALETENKNLRALLKEAKSSLSQSGNTAVPSAAGPSADTKALESQLRNVQDELEAATARVAQFEATLVTKNSKITSLEEEVSRLRSAASNSASSGSETAKLLESEIKKTKTEVANLEAELEKTAQEAEQRMAAKTSELKAQADKRVSEVEERMEAEKEEIMDAMAQEVEEIEKQKATEKATLEKEKEDLQKRLTAALNSSRTVVSGLGKVQNTALSVSRGYKDTAVTVRRELDNMKASMKLLMSDTLLHKLRTMEDQLKVMGVRYRKEMSERKRLHNLVQELKGNIRVYMRARPPTSKEVEQFGHDSISVTFPNPGEVKVFNEKNREKVWEFDEVFDYDSTQEKVYADVSALVVSVLDGFNVCIFAYGQTGSGKTFTMSGPPDNRGVNTRALDELFERAEARSSDINDTITVSLLEVYNEEIRDLLVDGGNSEKLEVRQGEFGNYVPGLTTQIVRNLDDVFNLINFADRNRSQATTNMNEHSSRSHMMLTVTVVSANKVTGATTRGKLNLVDLAGSERINKSGATGQALKEAQNINKSLSALGDVIAARAAKQGHVPFRNSTLTYLLQDSLSQDSKTLMIVCVSPVLYNSEETFCSLNFAARVRTVELGKAGKTALPAGGGAASASSTKSGASGAPSTTASGRGKLR